MAQPKKFWKEVKPLLLIYDDVIGDDQLKSYQSELSAFTTVSRHSKITNIFVT